MSAEMAGTVMAKTNCVVVIGWPRVSIDTMTIASVAKAVQANRIG